jgi:oxygen-independent coproporphyrinogen-3 oxidase
MMVKQEANAKITVESFPYGTAGINGRQDYSRALRAEMASAVDYSAEYCIRSVLITGTNPLMYGGEAIAGFLSTLTNIISVVAGADLSVNALPGSVNFSDLLALRDQGVTRISFDMQSFIQSELDQLGRTYASTALEVFADMVRQKMTFFDFDISLSYGLPGQTLESFNTSLQKALQLQPTHLTITPVDSGSKMDLLSFQAAASETIAKYNLIRYTPFHYSRLEYQCRYNQTLHTALPRFGFGVGGDWMIDGIHSKNTANLAEYLASDGLPEKIIAQSEPISAGELAAASIKGQLFNLQPVPRAEVLPGQQEGIHRLVSTGYLLADAETIRLTEQGCVHWNQVDSILSE